MKKVISKDGTPIVYDMTGSGPPVVIVGGALSYRSFPGFIKLAGLLAQHFTVINYDRRGRGDSGDHPLYSVEREVEDLHAVINDVGGSACVWGMSPGGALALMVAAGGVPIRKLAAYEPPYMVGDGAPVPPADHKERLCRLVAEGRRDDAVKFFLRIMGTPGIAIAIMRWMPFWPRMRAVANSLPYDAAVMGNYALPTETIRAVNVPTIVIAGEKSPPVLRRGAQEVANLLPGGKTVFLKGQSHNVSMHVLAPVLVDFFKGDER